MKTTDKRTFSDTCSILIALLKQHECSVNLDRMSDEDRLFMLATCAHEVMLHTIAVMTAAEYDCAVLGLDAINSHNKERLKGICDVMNEELGALGFKLDD